MNLPTLLQPVALRPAARYLGVVVLLAVLTGCAGPTPPPTDQPDAAADRAEQTQRAESLAEDGQTLAAVRVYRDLAQSSDPVAAQRWRLRATELLFEREYPELALEWHDELDSRPVPPELGTRKQLADAQAAVARRQGIRALRLLPTTRPDMDDAVRARVLATRADAYRLTGQPNLALLARIEREPLLQAEEAMTRNHREIWAILESMPVSRLELLAQVEGTPVLRGWAELGEAARGARLGRQRITAAIEQWRDRYPDHPAARVFVEDLHERVAAESAYPERIAVLLPLSGSLSNAGAAIRDGLFAAYYGQPAHVQRPDIEVYDTTGDAEAAARAYDRAVDDGAEFVIGPLSKSAVAAVASRASRDAPVLSLNYLPDDADETSASEALVQFGLLPEDEARQAAEAAIQNGHLNALALVPQGDWGDRMAAAFERRFDELGGVLLESQRYDPDTTDYGEAIQSLFGLDASYARGRRVRSTIGQSATFEPRRRQDVQVVFMAAMPRQARLIKPQLKFHRAGDLPIYATSHIFTGTPAPDADWDMNGLFFTDTPWILENIEEPSALFRSVSEHWPNAHDESPRLYALGIDAFSILPHLERLDSDAANTMAGRTGLLRLDERQRVRRQLQWARMQRGAPLPVARPGADKALEAEALADNP